MNNWKVIPTIVFATVLIFGAGVFSGGILVDYVKQARPRPVVKHTPPATPAASATVSTNGSGNAQGVRPIRPPEVLSKDFLQRLDAEIELTKDENDSIQKIINDGQNQMRKVLQDTRLEIREVLTPDQRDQFDQLMKHPFHKPIFITNAPPAVPTNAP